MLKYGRAEVLTTGIACLVGLLGLAGSPPASAASRDPAASLVLSSSDLGPGYRLNTSGSGPRTLSAVSYGDTGAVRRYVEADWLGGFESAFDDRWPAIAVISIADVFKPGAPVGRILRAWCGPRGAVYCCALQNVPPSAPLLLTVVD